MWISQVVRRMGENYPHPSHSAKVLPTPKNKRKRLF
jgi:hypothetical protein